MKHALKVLFYLKKNEAKEDGKCPVMGRITVGKTMVQFSAKMNVPLSLWDTPSGRANGKSRLATELNRTLDKINVSINAHHKEILENKGQVTAEQVKNTFQGIATEQETLVRYFMRHNQEFKKRIGINRELSTYQQYDISLKHLIKFLRKKYNLSDIPFSSLDFSFITSYDFYLRVELQRKPNTILGITRTMRRMIKLAIHEGIITRDPFDGYTPERPKAEQKYLTRAELDKIMTTPLDHPNRYLTRDMFLFSCFTGLAFRDMCNLTQKNLVRADDGVLWITTSRQKTGTPCHIPLLELPLQIIEKYKELTKDDKLLLMLSCGRLNINLKKIAKLCGIDKRLIFHMGRHTYASEITLSQGVPIESVSRMLGHRDLRSTQIYAKITNDKINEDMKSLETRIENKYQLAK